MTTHLTVCRRTLKGNGQGTIRDTIKDGNLPDSLEERVEGQGAREGKVVSLHLALDLLADDGVLLGVDFVQHYPQQGSVGCAVALLAYQLQHSIPK